jgi:diacylglycerol kinase
MNSFSRAVGFAVSGLQLAFRHHPNIQRQLCIGVLAVVLGFALNISVIEWMILTLTITMVFVAEFMNTVIEEVVDLITSEEHRQAKVAKDVAAGMVLLTSIMSIIIGALLFGPKLF